MRARGLVPRQVYVRAGHVDVLYRVERHLREPVLPSFLLELDSLEPMSTPWTTTALYRELVASDMSKNGVTFELVEGAEPSVSVTMPEHGDLAIQLAASGDQTSCPSRCAASTGQDRTVHTKPACALNRSTPGPHRLLAATASFYMCSEHISRRTPLLT